MLKSLNLSLYLLFGLALGFLAPTYTSAEEAVAISKDGVKIVYSKHGKGEPALIFVHGWSCERSFWRKQIPYFEPDYTVVTLDLAGHGRSGQERDVYSMRAFGEDVAAVVESIGAQQVILLGHSMGGPVIIEAAEIIPDKVLALVGIDTFQDFGEYYSEEEIAGFVQPFKEDFRTNTEGFVKDMLVKGTDPGLIAEVTAKMAGTSERTGVSAMTEMFKRSYAAEPPNIKAPVWAINADLWPTNADANQKFVPEFHLRLIHGTGHFLMLEAPDAFNTELGLVIKTILAEK
jgi:pimeloyl-ACP methyl ester carboxylesterase